MFVKSAGVVRSAVVVSLVIVAKLVVGDIKLITFVTLELFFNASNIIFKNQRRTKFIYKTKTNVKTSNLQQILETLWKTVLFPRLSCSQTKTQRSRSGNAVLTRHSKNRVFLYADRRVAAVSAVQLVTAPRFVAGACFKLGRLV